MTTLLERINAEARDTVGEIITGFEDSYKLAGIFNAYRPNGDGVERLFGHDAEGQLILQRVLAIYRATSVGWRPGDLYFIVRQPAPVEPMAAVALAHSFLSDIRALTKAVGVADPCEELPKEVCFSSQKKTQEMHPVEFTETLGDILAELDPTQIPAVLLQEAVYSMANDYQLTTYVLWPLLAAKYGIQTPLMDSYFELWRHGIRLTVEEEGICVVLP